MDTTKKTATASPPPTPSATSMNWVYPVALLIAVGIVAAGVYLAYSRQNWTMLAAGAVSVVGVLIAWPLAMSFGSRGVVCQSIECGLSPVYDRLEQFSVMLNEISEQQLLSDRTKSIAYREKDREVLRRAIADDINKRDWEAALRLVDEMDRAFGYKQEAERIREEINSKFSEHIQRQVQAGRALIDRHTSNQQWAAAFHEADRLQQQFPTLESARSLSNEIEQRRQAFKQKLLDEYNEKIAGHDTDGAISIVQKLDFYLTPEEGAGMAESVRNVFRDKLNQLKDKFTEAVHQSRWAEAHTVGEKIVRDFPNSQMAKEVREKLESLKQRATGTAVPTTAAG